MSDIKMIKELEPNPGVFVLDGKYKIERLDDLNWIIKVKDPAAKGRTTTVRGTKYVYKTDGYAQKGIVRKRYFGSVAEAVMFIVAKLEADSLVEDKRVISLEDYVGRLEIIKEQILDEFAGFKTDFDKTED